MTVLSAREKDEAVTPSAFRKAERLRRTRENMNRRKPPPGLSADLILTDRTETGGGFMPGGADAGLFISRGSLSGSRR